MIELKNITKIYKSQHLHTAVLKGVDLSLGQSDFMMVMGESGSGKTTLLNIIGGLDFPTSGTYCWGDYPINHESTGSLNLRRFLIGYIFQQSFLLPHFSALENVALPLMYQNISRKKRLKEAADMLERVGLGHRLHHTPSTLSGGEKQRTAVARALITKPKLILADEPTGALDPENTAGIMALLASLHSGGQAILMITHQHSLSSYATRTAHLERGVLTS